MIYQIIIIIAVCISAIVFTVEKYEEETEKIGRDYALEQCREALEWATHGQRLMEAERDSLRAEITKRNNSDFYTPVETPTPSSGTISK